MTIRIFPRPPILAATLILPLLIPTLIHTTTESLALQPAPSRRRLFRIGLRATTTTTGDDDDDDDNGDDDDDDDVRGREGRGAFDPLERIVRTVTRNEGYKFGDITKSVVGATTQGVEGTVRSVTRNKEYQFGDLTKKVVGATTHGVEGGCMSASSYIYIYICCMICLASCARADNLPPSYLSPFTCALIRHGEICHGERGI